MNTKHALNKIGERTLLKPIFLVQLFPILMAFNIGYFKR